MTRWPPSIPASTRPALVTGGAGFIGTNVAASLLDAGRRVRIFDNLTRRGVEKNLLWLRDTYGSQVEIALGDVRHPDAVRRAVDGVSEVYHFAAQVAVTASLADPLFDFAVNAGGTLTLLEALRALDAPPPLIFTSTNKVYGSLDDVGLSPQATRYVPSDPHICRCGIDERRSVDFHSPYGCSKGASDQYVLDYARTFRLPAVVFRMSCIYGPHQYGCEDQGWLAHFLLQALDGRAIRIYGDGRQVRDALYVDDLVRAFQLALAHMPALSGQAFNIGGGPERTVSLLELIDIISGLLDRPIACEFDGWRAADQRYYVSDTSKFRHATGWAPTVDVPAGVAALHAWLCRERGEFAGPPPLPVRHPARPARVGAPAEAGLTARQPS